MKNAQPTIYIVYDGPQDESPQYHMLLIALTKASPFKTQLITQDNLRDQLNKEAA